MKNLLIMANHGNGLPQSITLKFVATSEADVHAAAYKIIPVMQ
jgi:hypothetical protein